MSFQLETPRLLLREMTPDDYPALCKIMQDDAVMYAYEGAFDEQETQAWLEEQLTRYEQLGFGLWAVVLKETGEMIGQCGLTLQNWKGKQVLEIGYLFQKAFWHRGYAIEAASACKTYAFQTLQAETVFSVIRDTNLASQNVARRNGMKIVDNDVKHYRGVDMLHFLFSVQRHPQKSEQL
jgi:ribosomal-protein-alanine N-acetyltransferase